MNFDRLADGQLDDYLRGGEVYNSGWDAREAGRSRDCNPYCDNKNHERWDAGWLACDTEQEERGHEGTVADPSQ